MNVKEAILRKVRDDNRLRYDAQLEEEVSGWVLEHIRHSGYWKCFECVFNYHGEDSCGGYNKCMHDGTSKMQALRDDDSVMRGCACSWFIPSGKAYCAVAERERERRRIEQELFEFAWRHIDKTEEGESNDEKSLARMRREMLDLAGVML